MAVRKCERGGGGRASRGLGRILILEFIGPLKLMVGFHFKLNVV